MKVFINDVPITRGIDFRESPQKLRIKGYKEVQIASLLNSESVKVLDRGNLRTVVTFQVTCQHETSSEALMYVLSHAAEVTKVHGLATFDLENDCHVFYLKDASVKHVQSHYEGVNSYHSYELIGSKLLEGDELWKTKTD